MSDKHTVDGPAAAVACLRELIDRYWTLAYAEGKEGRDHDTEDGAAQECRSAIEELLQRLAAQPGEPNGWKLVPLEPTPGMIGAMAITLQANYGDVLGVAGAKEAYAAMLYASPPPQQGEKEASEVAIAGVKIKIVAADYTSGTQEGEKEASGVAPAVPDHRRDFENEWIRYAGHLPKRDGDGYAHGPIDLAWRFWKAARGVEGKTK